MNRNVIVVARNGVAARVSYDPTPVKVNGKLTIKSKTATFPFETEDVSPEFACLAAVNLTLEQTLASESALANNSRIQFITHRDTCNRMYERMNLLKNEGITADQIKDSMVKEWMSDSQAEIIGEFVDFMDSLPDNVKVRFTTLDDINKLTVKDENGKVINPRGNNLKKAIATAWGLCPVEDIEFEPEEGSANDEEAAF